MPIYEYKCDVCGKDFEVFQGISDPPVTACRFCKGRVRKQMSLSSFHLKGTGWYVTDYGGKKPSGQPADTCASEAEATGSALPEKANGHE
ncbi:MAG: zinc ribbon domain-containing protein [Syntrophales bacterium]|jgi:putative FmdB family regulatory protein|nr:zinc ribbon domain-containing protein [Syntrophales bacterium]MCK9528738.1 zinc ribbon domain-containing protein [Syntrophales bacterium]MDX9922971.1 zinc ribbon domain-containing protein [Syntrophales bacterium]